MNILYFIFWLIVAIVGMEFVAYGVHRFLFHGVLWKIHQTHHKPAQGPFELNDIFSLCFGLVATGLIIAGAADPLNSVAFPLGLGVTFYGLAYFIIHDIFTHRRFYPFNSQKNWLRTIRRGHQRHHQTVEKEGFEPYGLFLFDYETFKIPPRRQRKSRLSK